jgi:hypothetical protein
MEKDGDTPEDPARGVSDEALAAWDRIITKLLRRRDDEILEVAKREQRFLVGGNAGGLIASLSLAGAMIGASGTEVILPWQLFAVIVIFFTGLLCIGVRVLAEPHALANRLNRDIVNDLTEELGLEAVPERLRTLHKPLPKQQRWVEAAESARYVAWATLAGGSIIGLVVLFRFIRF